MGGEDLLTIVDQWSRSLSPPRTLLVRLLELARAADHNIFDLRLLQHDNDILTPIAAAVSSESGALRLDAHPALAQAVREVRVTYLPPDHYVFPAVVDLDRAPSHLLEIGSRGAMTGEVREQMQYLSRMVAQALELRDLRTLSGFSQAMTAMGEKAQEVVSTRLHGALSSMTGARDISQMAGIIARDLLSNRELLTLNELRYDEAGQLVGWRPVADNSGVANPRRELKLELAWHRVGEHLRQAIINGEPFIANSLGPIERPLVGTALFEWMQLNGIASAVFYPISHPTRTIAVMAVFSTVQRNISEAALQSFVRLAERMALLTVHNQHLSEVTVREYWATQMLRTSQHLFDAQDATDITRAAIDALPTNVRLVALALFDVALKPGRWPDWLRVEALSSRAETRTLPFSADKPEQQDMLAQQMIQKLIEGKPVLERLANGKLRRFAENLAEGLVARGCTAVSYIGLVADDALYGLLIVGADGVEPLEPLAFVLRDMNVSISQSVQRLMSQHRNNIPEDLSAIVNFTDEVRRAGSREQLMKAVRRCLGEQYAIVAWVDVSVNPMMKRPNEIKLALVLRGDHFETMHDYPLHHDLDDEQYDWYRRIWLTSSRFGKVVHHLSEEDMGYDPILPSILHEGDQVYSVVALPVLDDRQLMAHVYVAFLSSSHEATEQFKQLCNLIRDVLSLKVPSMRDASTNQTDSNAPLLQVINDLAIRLLTVRDERMLLTEGARSFATALNVDHAGVTILRDDQSADVVAEYPDAGLVGLNIPADNPYLVMTVRDRTPLHVEDVRTDPNLTPENREALAASGIRKMLFLPMLDQNQKCFGSIGLDIMREEYEFDLNMVEIARTLTNQLAMLYLSLRQVRSARQQAEQLAAMTDLTSSLVGAQRDDDVYESVAHKIRDIVPADDLWVLIDTSWLEGKAAWPVVGDLPPQNNVQVVMQFEQGVPHKPSEPITFLLENTPADKAHGGELVSIKDLQATDLHPLLSSRPVRAVLAAPIKVDERVVGVIEVDSHTPNIYTRADETVFEQIAAQVSGALNRARALDASKKQAATQAAVAKFSNTVQAAGSHRNTMVEGARGYQGLLGANQVKIQMGQPPERPDKSNGNNNTNGNGSIHGSNGVNGDKR